MRRGLAAWEGTGARLMRPYFLALLADALPPEAADEALRLLDDAILTGQVTGERWYQAELLRLKGERMLSRARSDATLISAGMQCLQESLSEARAQRAQSLELRTAMSLVRLARTHGTGHSALTLIQPILAQFTEGLDTPDLREARALVDAEMSA
jgi:predicted ATPase